jgi:hypothetical protein
MCVRPVLTMSCHASALAAMAARNAATEGSRAFLVALAAATYIADGKVSFDDCDMFT